MKSKKEIIVDSFSIHGMTAPIGGFFQKGLKENKLGKWIDWQDFYSNNLFIWIPPK